MLWKKKFFGSNFEYEVTIMFSKTRENHILKIISEEYISSVKL